MLRPRVIPSLLIQSRSLVKTIQFGKFDYIGDPCNTMRIFNELEVDELMVLDISATSTGSGPDFELLQDIAVESGRSMMLAAYWPVDSRRSCSIPAPWNARVWFMI
jgi:imidazole glycerol phosphate synthase subunit HisF